MGLEMNIRFTDVLRRGTLKNYYVNGNVNGYQFDIRLGYYRGHYLSVIDTLAVAVDGEKISDDDITFCLNGKEFHPAELKYQFSEFWTILTPATIKIHKPGGLSQGDHHIDLTLMLHSPYMPLPGATKPHQYTPINSCEQAVLTLTE